MSFFADDKHIIGWNSDLNVLKEEMSASLNLIIKWLQG
jgi:hypothetical protein